MSTTDKGCRITLDGIAGGVTEEDIRQLFGQHEQVLDVTINRKNGVCTGTAWVVVGGDEDANKAITRLRGGTLRGRKISLRITQNAGPHTAGSTSPMNSEEAWLAAFDAALESSHPVKSPTRFPTTQEKPFVDRGPYVCINGLHPDTREIEVRQVFARHVKFRKITIGRNPLTGKASGSGCVTLYSWAAVPVCVTKLDNQPFKGKILRVLAPGYSCAKPAKGMQQRSPQISPRLPLAQSSLPPSESRERAASPLLIELAGEFTDIGEYPVIPSGVFQPCPSYSAAPNFIDIEDGSPPLQTPVLSPASVASSSEAADSESASIGAHLAQVTRSAAPSPADVDALSSAIKNAHSNMPSHSLMAVLGILMMLPQKQRVLCVSNVRYLSNKVQLALALLDEN